MTILTVEEVTNVIGTDWEDFEVQRVIDRVTGEIEQLYGEYQDSALSVSLTEEAYGNAQNMFLKRPISSVTSVTEDDIVLASTDYKVWPYEGRLERLPRGTSWGTIVSVVYKPIYQGIWKQVALDLVRLDIERTSFDTESVGGEYSYKSKDWLIERGKILKRIKYLVI